MSMRKPKDLTKEKLSLSNNLAENNDLTRRPQKVQPSSNFGLSSKGNVMQDKKLSSILNKRHKQTQLKDYLNDSTHTRITKKDLTLENDKDGKDRSDTLREGGRSPPLYMKGLKSMK